MKDREWLQSLKAGDEVGLVSGRAPYVTTFPTVERTTATQIIVNGKRFNRKGGDERSNSFYADAIVKPTDELKAQVKAEAELLELRAKANQLRASLHVPHDRHSLAKFIAALEPLVGEGR